jgi:hypothetical protein
MQSFLQEIDGIPSTRLCIYLYADTGLDDSDVTLNSPQIEAVHGTLRYIAKLNAEAGRTDSKNSLSRIRNEKSDDWRGCALLDSNRLFY